jgi:hypothetical protein
MTRGHCSRLDTDCVLNYFEAVSECEGASSETLCHAELELRDIVISWEAEREYLPDKSHYEPNPKIVKRKVSSKLEVFAAGRCVIRLPASWLRIGWLDSV